MDDDGVLSIYLLLVISMIWFHVTIKKKQSSPVSAL